MVHSWPSTDFAPMSTSPSWQRTFVPCPSHDQRPRWTTAFGPISKCTPGQTKASPSVFSRPRKRSFSQADPAGWDLVREVYPETGKAAIVGFTGAPGAGKSTLIGALVKSRRALEREVAVLSIDPSSPFTKGALLGDRIRLTEHFLDPGV